MVCYITEGYALTNEDFAHGHEIDLNNDVPNGTKNSLNDAITHGHGNYQGDMVLTPDQLKEIHEQGTDRALMTSVADWPHSGESVNIPYVITDSTYTSWELAKIARSMEEFEINTCIR